MCSQREGIVLKVNLPEKHAQRIHRFGKNSTVYSIKKYVEIKDNIKTDLLKASFNGTVMDDNELLVNLQIKQNSEIFLDFFAEHTQIETRSNIILQIIVEDHLSFLISTPIDQVIFFIFLNYFLNFFLECY